MKRTGWFLAAAVLVASAGCATSGGSGSGLGSGPYSFAQGDFPASGKCRAWDIGKKAEEQKTRDVACESLTAEGPTAGWVLRRSGGLVFLNKYAADGKMLESHRYDGFTAEYLGQATVPK